MAFWTATGRSRKKNSIIWSGIKNIIFSSQGFPIFLIVSVVAILFVMYRMKAVELDYEISNTNKNIEKSNLENKDLKARRARLLSTKDIKEMAREHDLRQPGQEQVIVIP